MPDWSYHTLFKPLLSRVPSSVSREFIHNSMSIISKIPYGPNLIEFLGHLHNDTSLEEEIHHIKIKNKIGLASNIDPCLTGINAFMNLGFGVIEIGPISIKDTNTCYSPLIDLKSNELIGYDKFNPLSIDQVVTTLSKINKKASIFARIAGSFEEFIMIESKLSKFVDAYIIDINLAKEITSNYWTTSKPICLSINLSEIEIINLEEYKVDSIIIEEIPSISIIEQKNYLLTTIRNIQAKHFKKPIFTKGGVLEPVDATQLISAGASIVFLSHGYVLSGPGLPKRINEALLLNRREKSMTSLGDGWIYYFLFGLFMFFGGLLALIISLTTIILPYDEHFLMINRDLILEFNERILPFMSHDRMTLAGTIMSGGILFMSLAGNGIRHTYHWAKKASDISAIFGFLAIFLFIGFGYFDWLHALFWLILLIPYLIGFYKTKGFNRSPESENLTNHKYWKTSLLGQLSFIILGFSIILGGSIISYVGITTTFVKTDLNYLCMTPSQLNEFNQHLIPVISHDRAGFGGGLVSVGLLVLMISLWGFRQNHRWIWWTLFLGSLPAFITAFLVHFMIGYTDFYHLLPPFIAFMFLLIGIITTYHYLNFNKKDFDEPTNGEIIN